jgi:hypothetical protein
VGLARLRALLALAIQGLGPTGAEVPTIPSAKKPRAK